MSSVDLWVEKICEENYEDLYVAGIRYLLKTNPADIVFLPDDIQEVYLLLCKRKDKLIHHPNITGWLVRTLKRVIEDRAYRARKERARIAFSIDDGTQALQSQALYDENTDPLEMIAGSSQDMLWEIEQEIGKENLKLLQAYYQEKQTADELAGKMQMAGAALRMRISRLKRKILDRLDYL